MDLYEAFNRGRTAGEERKRQSAISQYFQGATRGDPNALAQVYQADPNAGMQAQKFQQSQQDRDTEGLLNAAKFYTQSQDPKAWAYIHQKLTTHPEFSGLTQGMPDQITTPEDLQGSVKLAQSLVSAYGGGQDQAVQSRFVDDQGNMVALMRDGSTRVVGKADPRTQLFTGDNGVNIVDLRNATASPVMSGVSPSQSGAVKTNAPLVEDGMPVSIDPTLPPQVQAEIRAQIQNKGGSEVPQQLQAPAPKISPAEQMRLELARRADERAARAEQRQIQAQAVTGKPPTEDERKAAGWYQQAIYALGNMRAALRADPNAATPGLVEAYVPGQELKTRSMSPARQRYAQASSSFAEAALRAATGAGINEFEAKQKIAELTPQRGESDAVIQQKIGALEMYVRSLRSRAGRALPAPMPQPSGQKPTQRQIKRTGTVNGRKVVQYSDGTIEYAD